jgi:hypothetical protein
MIRKANELSPIGRSLEELDGPACMRTTPNRQSLSLFARPLCRVRASDPAFARFPLKEAGQPMVQDLGRGFE